MCTRLHPPTAPNIIALRQCCGSNFCDHIESMIQASSSARTQAKPRRRPLLANKRSRWRTAVQDTGSSFSAKQKLRVMMNKLILAANTLRQSRPRGVFLVDHAGSPRFQARSTAWFERPLRQLVSAGLAVMMILRHTLPTCQRPTTERVFFVCCICARCASGAPENRARFCCMLEPRPPRICSIGERH